MASKCAPSISTAHSYVHDVWPLIQDSEEIAYLTSMLDIPPLKNKIDIDNIDFRLQQMDEQGIDIQAVSPSRRAVPPLGRPRNSPQKLSVSRTSVLLSFVETHPDRFVGSGCGGLTAPGSRC